MHNNKSQNTDFTQTMRENFKVILIKLINILGKANLAEHTQILQIMIELLNQQKDKEFVKILNGIDMWGGSGAVWEVYIEDQDIAREFEKGMIKLIDLMEKANVLGKGIKSIRKIFVKNLDGKV